MAPADDLRPDVVVMDITVATVKVHVARLFTKLGARARAHLGIAAYGSGLVTPTR
ncbi:LuxR C-terminal-related transcriptional regulator [Streptomyces alfalfae]